jgi:hypothetical protein
MMLQIEPMTQEEAGHASKFDISSLRQRVRPSESHFVALHALDDVVASSSVPQRRLTLEMSIFAGPRKISLSQRHSPSAGRC